MSNANERFLYEIRPIKPIKDLIPGKGIKAPCSMQLTKEEALHCMKYGSVYRNFSDSGMNPIRVTGSTIDRLHNAKFISEDEWMKKIGKEIVSEQQEEESTVEETPVEEVPVTTEEVVEENTIVEETPVVEEVVAKEETTYESYMTADAKLVLTAFGTVGRIAKSAVQKARKEGMRVGLFRPITLFPFPEKQLNEVAQNAEMILDLELNKGQMLLDVRSAVFGACPVEFFGRTAGGLLTPDMMFEKIQELYKKLEHKTEAGVR